MKVEHSGVGDLVAFSGVEGPFQSTRGRDMSSEQAFILECCRCLNRIGSVIVLTAVIPIELLFFQWRIVTLTQPTSNLRLLH